MFFSIPANNNNDLSYTIIMSITTRTGDDGNTMLCGGERVKKNDPRVIAYGEVDELNAAIGVARSAAVEAQTHSALEPVQHDLFRVGASLAALTDKELNIDIPQIAAEHLEQLDNTIKNLEASMTPLTGFIIPAGNSAASHIHLARTICRRAERSIISVA